MNIDLLLTKNGDAGLVCDGAFESPVAGVIFDAEMRQVTLEYANLETTEMNIPVEDGIAESLLWAFALQVGVIVDDKIQETRQVPLMHLNDPGGQAGYQKPARASSSVSMFERFLKDCSTGQPLHRDDLGDESVSGSVVGGVNRAVLQFAPQLARQKTLEATHDLKMAGPAPSGPGMGLGGRGGGGAVPTQQHRPAAPRRTEEED